MLSSATREGTPWSGSVDSRRLLQPRWRRAGASQDHHLAARFQGHVDIGARLQDQSFEVLEVMYPGARYPGHHGSGPCHARYDTLKGTLCVVKARSPSPRV
jgi:hypothetical protein